MVDDPRVEVRLLAWSEADLGHWEDWQWVGEWIWDRMCGATRLRFVLGRAVAATPVCGLGLENLRARRLMLTSPADLERCWRIEHGARVLRGSLKFGPGLAEFVADELQPESSPPDEPLGRVLFEQLRPRLADREFAGRAYRSLCGVEWFDPDGKPHGVTHRAAAGLIADIRGVGEEYIDFYLAGEPSGLDREFVSLMAERGWTPGRPR